MVEDSKGFSQMMKKLHKAPVIGVDTESDSSYAYQEKVCLIQISDLHNDYILDTLKVKDISAFNEVLSDPDKPTVLHGADYDVVCLRRDYDFQIRGLFDTLIAAQLIGLERIGLADLLDHYFGVLVDKKFQRHNWALRPLRAEHLEYARGDTHFLLALRELMTRQLKAKNRMPHMREECAFQEDRRLIPKSTKEGAFLRLKGANKLDKEGLRVLRALDSYRDMMGKKLDRPVFKVISTDWLIKLANARPETQDELDKMLRNQAAMRRRFGAGLHEAILDGLDDERPLPSPDVKKPDVVHPFKPRNRGKSQERVFALLKNWRQQKLAREADLTPIMLASNNTLKAIAMYHPATLEELSQISDVRKWQVNDWGDEVIDVLHDA